MSSPQVPLTIDSPVVPRYGGGCVADIVPALLDPSVPPPSFLDGSVVEAPAVVVLVIDGMGWEQLTGRERFTPTISGLEGGPITTVAPSTTASALTSIVTGLAPGEHGLVGYRIAVDGEVLNVLRWSTPAGDARARISPERFQTAPAFLGHRPPVVSKAEFARSGFTRAHLRDTRLVGYRAVSSIPVEIRRLVRAGEPFVYAYYDALDRIAHEYGLGEHYEAELESCDRLVADVLMALPSGSALVVTADHGLVDCSGGEVELGGDVRALMLGESGEARFRWLHAEPGRERDLLEVARSVHGDRAWVRSVDEIVSEGWFGPLVGPAALERLGDVALVAQGCHAFVDPADQGAIELVARHGSLTSAEMMVPALTHVI